MAFFGLIKEENIAKGSVEEAHKAINEALDKLDPLTHRIEMTAAGILDTLLTRVGKMKITVTFDIPEAGADWQKTPPPK